MATKFKLSALTLCLTPFLSSPGFAEIEKSYDTLYTLSNAAHNEVYAFQRDSKGMMKTAGQYPTGGAGTGNSLSNQGALALSEDRDYLFAINAGSNEVSVFRAYDDGLELLDHAAETGMTPVSVTMHGDLVYVVNSGDDSIFGYRFDREKGKLMPITGSYQKLGATGTGAAQISFDEDGDILVVTEKAINKIITFSLNDQGIPTGNHVIDSAGATPFGFAFGRHDQFFVSEAEGGGGNPGAATVSSYKLIEDGSVKLLSGAVAADETAACWLVTTPNGHWAFTADTPANAISAFSIDIWGNLTLANKMAATENNPADLAISPDGEMLYTLNTGDKTIGEYSINMNGGLKKVHTITSLPTGATGLVFRHSDDYTMNELRFNNRY